MDPTPWPPHRAYLEGPAHLSRLPGRKVLRLEARGLFARLRRFWCPKEEFPPGFFRVRLHFRTDGEGFRISMDTGGRLLKIFVHLANEHDKWGGQALLLGMDLSS